MASVWRDWRPPTDADFGNMIEHDKQHWKMTRFIKDPEEYEAVVEVMKKNIRKLFHLYITWASKGNFPGISWLDFSNLNVACDVLDKKGKGNVNAAAIDNFFLAAAAEGNSRSGCHRFQFLEAITRVANAKYRE